MPPRGAGGLCCAHREGALKPVPATVNSTRCLYVTSRDHALGHRTITQLCTTPSSTYIERFLLCTTRLEATTLTTPLVPSHDVPIPIITNRAPASMPIYHARGVSVHLGEMPLADTITSDIVLRKGKAAKQQCENAEKQLQESTPLTEERVTFPGDEAGFELNWLGNAPFMQVQASSDLSRPNDKQDSFDRAENAIAETAQGRRHSQLFTGTHAHV